MYLFSTIGTIGLKSTVWNTPVECSFEPLGLKAHWIMLDYRDPKRPCQQSKGHHVVRFRKREFSIVLASRTHKVGVKALKGTLRPIR
jgi:hypothetical protein